MKQFLALCLILFCSALAMAEKSDLHLTFKYPLGKKEQPLARRVNDLREAHNLPRIVVTKSLTKTARIHVRDLEKNRPDTGKDHGLPCNLHSWSNNGYWTPVCYTEDHQYSHLMWNKPREITEGRFTGNGYEIAFYDSDEAMSKAAVESWENCSSHLDVILERGIFADKDWKSMGVGIYRHYAVVWFSDSEDPLGPILKPNEGGEGQ